MWIDRDLRIAWAAERSLAVRALVGVRQGGKSSFLDRLGDGRRYVTLDDASARSLAETDPELFLETYAPPVVIDECHLAPTLFPAIKRLIDAQRRNRPGTSGSIWLTGSHQLLVDHSIRESLAGRVTHFELHPLSAAELHKAGRLSIPELLMKGGFPQLYHADAPLPVAYFNDYIRTVLERDVARASGVEKLSAFLRATRLLAGRVGNLLNMSEVARDAAVRSTTIDDWVGALERMGIIFRVPAFHSSRTTRLIKAPKVMFCDVGLAVRLQGWSEPGPILLSPAVGGLFENVVFLELLKTRAHRRKSWEIHHFRSRDGEEIDFVVEGANGKLLAIEAKWSRSAASSYDRPAILDKTLGNIPCWVVTSGAGPVVRRPSVTIVPLHAVADELETWAD